MAFDILGTLSALGTMAMIALGAGVAGLITFWVWQILKYKTQIIIREIVSGRAVISHDKARRIKDRDGNYWWKLLKSKVKIPEPNSDAVETTVKGKKFVEFYKIEDAGFFPAKSKKGWVAINNKMDRQRFEGFCVDGFEPLTTNQRSLFLNEMREAEDYNKLGKHELIAKAIPYVALIMILLIMLLFSGEFFTPLFDHNERIASQQVEMYDKMDVLVDKLDKAVNNRITLIGEEQPGLEVLEVPN